MIIIFTFTINNNQTAATLTGVRQDADWAEALDAQTSCLAFPSTITTQLNAQTGTITVPVTQINLGAYGIASQRYNSATITEEDIKNGLESMFIVKNSIQDDKYEFEYTPDASITNETVNERLPISEYHVLVRKEMTVSQSGPATLTSVANNKTTHTPSDCRFFARVFKGYEQIGYSEGNTAGTVCTNCTFNIHKGDVITIELGYRSLLSNHSWPTPLKLQWETSSLGVSILPLEIKGVVIPSTVTTIVASAFSVGYGNLTDVWHETEDEVVINSYAFQNCGNLKFCEWFINSSMEIRTCAFENCGFETLAINQPVILAHGAFRGCSRMTDLIVQNDGSVSYYSRSDLGGSSTYNWCHCFENCKSLKNVIWKGSKVGAANFKNCTALVMFTVDTSSMKTSNFTIENSAFMGCSQLMDIVGTTKQLNFNLTTTAIANEGGHFQGCSAMSDATLQQIVSNLTNIPDNTFNGCTGLTSFKGNSSLTSIGQGAFRSCTSLKTVDLTECTKLEDIMHSAFAICNSISDLRFCLTPDHNVSLTIGQQCFYNGLNINVPHHIKLPSNVKEVGKQIIYSTDTPSEPITIELDGWYNRMYLVQEGATEGEYQIELPENPNWPFRFGPETYGTLIGAPCHSLADPAVDTRATKAYQWGMYDVYYKDEQGLDVGKETFSYTSST